MRGKSLPLSAEKVEKILNIQAVGRGGRPGASEKSRLGKDSNFRVTLAPRTHHEVPGHSEGSNGLNRIFSKDIPHLENFTWIFTSCRRVNHICIIFWYDSKSNMAGISCPILCKKSKMVPFGCLPVSWMLLSVFQYHKKIRRKKHKNSNLDFFFYFQPCEVESDVKWWMKKMEN